MESLNVSLVDVLEDFASSLRSQLPLSSTPLVADPPTQLIKLSNLGTLDYSFFDVYTCDIFTLLLFFLIAVAVKLLIVFGLNKQAVGRVQVSLGEKYGHEVETEVARNVLKKHLVAVIGWGLAINIESACLVLQCCAWRLWKLENKDLREEDEHFILGIIKLLLIGYAADLLVGDKGVDIYLHHSFGFILLFVGQWTLFDTQNADFPRLANWMILQATLALPLYIGLGLVAVAKYYQAQNDRPVLQRKSLEWAHRSLQVATWSYMPTKIVPAVFSLYWLAQMWDDVSASKWGVVWIVFATSIIPLLLLLQIFVLSDSVAAMSAYIGFKVNGGQIPSRYGPIRRLVTSLLRVRRTQSDQEGTSIARDDVISYKAQMGHCRQSSVKDKPEIVTPRNRITTSFMHRQ
ncbi:hypothetical protein JCM5353_006528 [Sporobolomyces roseus]